MVDSEILQLLMKDLEKLTAQVNDIKQAVLFLIEENEEIKSKL